MSKPDAVDVLICGAGAAGLTLAIDLARRGVSFRIIDKIEQPFAGSRGKGIKPRTQEIFEDLGVIDRIVACGGTYPPEREHRADGTYADSLIIETGEPTPEEPYLIPLMVPQYFTEAVLRERVVELGGRVEFGKELLGFEQDERGLVAHVRAFDGAVETLRARYLIGADGGRSFVRHTLNIEFPGKTLGVRALVADAVVEGLSDDAWHRWGEGDVQKQIFVCPLRGTTLFQLQAPVALEADVDLSPEGLTRIVSERTGRGDIVIREVRWSSVFHMSARLADRYRMGRVFLCGDAAHVHPPTGGQGLNTSIQDAYNLGWKLAAVIAGTPDRLLDTYEAERRPIAADVLGLSTRLLQALKERGELRRGREGQQLDLGYAGSSLALNTPARDPTLLVAGDRAPDAPMKGRAGQSVRAFELYQGGHWTLLGFETPSAASPAPRRNLHIHRIGEHGDVLDAHGYFQAAYGVTSGDWVLVRPDGYVGAMVSAHTVDSLQAYLEEWISVPQR